MTSRLVVVRILAFALGAFPLLAQARYFGNPEAASQVLRGAMTAGEPGPVAAILAPDVIVYQDGREDRTRDAYVARSLADDLAFFRAYFAEVISQDVREDSESAWVTTRTRYIGKTVDQGASFIGTETLVLRRIGGSWQIVHIHRSRAEGAPAN